MDSILSPRRTFALFHITLALVVFLQSVGALRRAMGPHPVGASYAHLILIAGIEAGAAILFLFPKTLQVGGTLLLTVFAIALVVHGIRGELALFVYAAGVILVMVHGSTWGKELFQFRGEST